MKEIIQKAEELADKEAAGVVKPLFAIANRQGQVLAKKLNANKDIVMLGTLFMDLKLKQALEENRQKDHVKMSLEAAKEFFEKVEVSEEIKKKVYNCIEAHHGKIPFNCIEAEICANADCYKFLHPKGMFQYLNVLGGRGKSFLELITEAEAKLDEKWNVLSLKICKEELESNYVMFKKLFEKAKENSI